MKKNISSNIILGGVICVSLILVMLLILVTDIGGDISDVIVTPKLSDETVPKAITHQPKNITISVSESLDISGTP